MNNPMISALAREQIPLYSPALQDVFHAVNALTYEACRTIEGPLGEGRGGRLPFDYDRLIEATRENIQMLAGGDSHYLSKQLRSAMAQAGLGDAERVRITAIMQQEARARIDQATSTDRQTFREHGHHGRQYIARNTVERVMKEVLPLKP